MYHALTQTMHVIYVHHFMIKNPLSSCCIHTTQGLLCILNPIWYAIMSYAFTIISLKTYKRFFHRGVGDRILYRINFIIRFEFCTSLLYLNKVSVHPYTLKSE